MTPEERDVADAELRKRILAWGTKPFMAWAVLFAIGLIWPGDWDAFMIAATVVSVYIGVLMLMCSPMAYRIASADGGRLYAALDSAILWWLTWMVWLFAVSALDLNGVAATLLLIAALWSALASARWARRRHLATLAEAEPTPVTEEVVIGALSPTTTGERVVNMAAVGSSREDCQQWAREYVYDRAVDAGMSLDEAHWIMRHIVFTDDPIDVWDFTAVVRTQDGRQTRVAFRVA